MVCSDQWLGERDFGTEFNSMHSLGGDARSGKGLPDELWRKSHGGLVLGAWVEFTGRISVS